MFCLLFVLLASTGADLYNLEVTTATTDWADTDSDIYITLIGKKRSSSAFLLDKSWHNDFQKGAVDTYSINVEETLGTVQCIRLTTPDHDAWMVDKVVVTPEGGDKAYFYNVDATQLSADPNDKGESSLELCEQGTETYYITIRTSTEAHAGTDQIWPRITLTGVKGTTQTGFLDNRDHDDFRKGGEDTFTVPGMKFVGKVRCVEVEVGGEDAWKFDYLEVHCDRYRSPWYFQNEDGVWMSTDEQEGEEYLKLC